METTMEKLETSQEQQFGSGRSERTLGQSRLHLRVQVGTGQSQGMGMGMGKPHIGSVGRRWIAAPPGAGLLGQ